jgi:hypothetical protein
MEATWWTSAAIRTYGSFPAGDNLQPGSKTWDVFLASPASLGRCDTLPGPQSSLYPGAIRGYIPELVGARVVGAGGEHDRYLYTVGTEIEGLPAVDLCGNVMHAMS